MGFDFPEAFLLLGILPPLLWVLRRGERRTEDVARAFKSRPSRRSHFTLGHLLVSLFIVSLVLVGARPYVEPRHTGDYVFVADVSRSMSARFSCSEPTFLDRAKRVMRNVLARIPEGKFGIVAADRLAFPITQMTYDHAYLNEVIDHGIFVGLTYEATATNLANALSVVAEKKERLPDIYGNVRHVILLSDGYEGGDYRRRFRKSLDQLANAGISVAAVGIGNPAETPVPVDENGKCLDEYAEVDGRVVAIPLRADLLRFVAEETQGSYFAEGETDGLVQFLRDEGLRAYGDESEFDERQRRDIGWLFLVPAAVALFGILLIKANIVLSRRT